jgi:hypothetical protein
MSSGFVRPKIGQASMSWTSKMLSSKVSLRAFFMNLANEDFAQRDFDYQERAKYLARCIKNGSDPGRAYC